MCPANIILSNKLHSHILNLPKKEEEKPGMLGGFSNEDVFLTNVFDNSASVDFLGLFSVFLGVLLKVLLGVFLNVC